EQLAVLLAREQVARAVEIVVDGGGAFRGLAGIEVRHRVVALEGHRRRLGRGRLREGSQLQAQRQNGSNRGTQCIHHLLGGPWSRRVQILLLLQDRRYALPARGASRDEHHAFRRSPPVVFTSPQWTAFPDSSFPMSSCSFASRFTASSATRC